MKVHKNRQSRRVFVALLTTVIVAASLSGCGGENAKSSIPSGTAENVNDSFRIQLYPFVYQQIFAGQNNVEWIVDFQNGESSLVGHAGPWAGMLLMIATGVNMIIRVSIVKASYDTLLQEGEYTQTEKKARRKLDTLSGIYWCLATAVYLGWSFLTMRWEITWVVWPVAGVLYAAISGVARLFMGLDER